MQTVQTVKAVAVKTDLTDSEVAEKDFLFQAAEPVFSPVGGTYTEAQTVYLTCASPGATIYYSTPDVTLEEYDHSTGISVASSMTIEAYAEVSGWDDSDVVSATYTITGGGGGTGSEVWQLVTSTDQLAVGDEVIIAASSDAGTYSGYAMAEAGSSNIRGTTVTKNSDETEITNPQSATVFTVAAGNTSGTWAFYSSDLGGYLCSGTSTKSNELKTQKELDDYGSATITYSDGAISTFVFGGTDGDRKYLRFNPNVQSGTASPLFNCYTSTSTTGSVPAIYKKAGGQPTCVAPTFTPEEGVYNSPQTVTLSCQTEGATILYTTDGTDPDDTSTAYAGEEIALSVTTSIKAVACKADYRTSPVAGATYELKAVSPTFGLASGVYFAKQTVPISAADGFDIYYTTDGTEPTTASTLYTEPLTISVGATVKAIACKEGWTASDVAEATYTIYIIGDGSTVWEKVTDASTLAAGDQVIIVSDLYDMALSTSQTGTAPTYREPTAITKFNEDGTDYAVVFSDAVDIFTLENGTVSGSFAFHGANGYIATVTDGTNSLATVTEIDNNSSAIVTVEHTNGSTNYTCAVEFQCGDASDENNQPYLRYYSGSNPRFACYSSNSTNGGVWFYRQVKINNVEAPVFTLPTGYYAEAQATGLTCPTDGADIYYTIDGSTPDRTSTKYDGTPLSITETCTVKAVAYVEADDEYSSVTTAEYIIEWDPEGICQYSDLIDAISLHLNGAKYTTTYDNDGFPSGAVYAANAYTDAVRSVVQMNTQTSTTNDRRGSVVCTTSGGYVNSIVVYWSDETIESRYGNRIEFYGSNTPYTDPLNVFSSDPAVRGDYIGSLELQPGAVETLRVITGNYQYVAMRSAGGVITPARMKVVWSTKGYLNTQDQVAAPRYTPSAGTYTATQRVKIESDTPGATIYYTTDGTEPATSSTLYTGPVVVEKGLGDCTIKAIAVKPDYANSAVTSAKYSFAEEDLSDVYEWRIVTNVYSLEVGDQLIIASDENSTAMTSDGSAHNRPEVAVNRSADKTTLEYNPNVAVLTLVKGATVGSFAFYTTNADGTSGYLCATGEDEYNRSKGKWEHNNDLTTQETIDSYASASITFENDYPLITFLGDVSDVDKYSRYLRYNFAANLFSCYTDKATDGAVNNHILLYRKALKEGAARVETPAFDPEGGRYSEAQTLAISCATPGATIYYTTDGTVPDKDSEVYSGPFAVDGDMIVKAIAVKEGYTDSSVATAIYIFDIEDDGKVYAYELVTDLSQLDYHDQIIVAAVDYDMAVSIEQKKDNRGETAVTKVLDKRWIVNPSDQVAIFTLSNGVIDGVRTDDRLCLYTDQGDQAGYIFASGETNNLLRTKSTLDELGSFTLVIDDASTGAATIAFLGGNARNLLRYNATSGLFSAYGEGNNQQPVALYRKAVMTVCLKEAMALPHGTRFTMGSKSTVSYANGAYTFLYEDGDNEAWGLIYKEAATRSSGKVRRSSSVSVSSGNVLADGWSGTVDTETNGRTELVPDDDLLSTVSETAADPGEYFVNGLAATTRDIVNRPVILHHIVFTGETPAEDIGKLFYGLYLYNKQESAWFRNVFGVQSMDTRSNGWQVQAMATEKTDADGNTTVFFLPTEVQDDTTGIEDIVSGAGAEAVYYNLQGVRVAAPQPGRFYIEVRGTDARKVYIK